MFYKEFLWIPVLILSCLHSGNGQSSFQSENLTLTDGLSDVRIQDIVQDKYGYMWFGTSYGLNRYDGYSIHQYYNDSSRHSLPSNGIYSLYKDTRGDLWIGTAFGPVKFDYTHNHFIRFDSVPGLGTSLIRVITEDPDGNIFIGGSKGIYRYNHSKNTWLSITDACTMQNELRAVRGLYFKDKNTLYVTTEKRGFYVLDLVHYQGNIIIYDDHEFCAWDILMYDMEPLGNEELLISFLSPGVKAFNLRTEKIRSIPGPFYDSKTVRWNTVPKIYRDKQNRIWIASIHYGLCEYLIDQDTIISYLNTEKLPYGLMTGPVNCIFQDRQNNLWVGSRDNGVFKINPSEHRVLFYDQDDFQYTKLQISNINFIKEWNPETAIIGQTNGFSLFNLKTKTFTNYPGEAINRGNNFLKGAFTVSIDRLGYLWFGTSGLGLMRWRKGETFTRNYYRAEFGNMNYPDVFVFQSLTLSDGKFLNLGLGRISLLDPINLTNTSTMNATDKIYTLYDTRYMFNVGQDKILLLEGNSDFIMYDYKQNTVIQLPNFLNQSFPGIQVSKMECDSTGNYWFASNLGLVLLEPDSCIQIYKMESGSQESYAVSGFQKVGNTMWIANSRRIGRLNLETGKIQYLSEADGFSPKQLNGSTLTRLSNGNLYLGCTDGIYEILPDHFSDGSKEYNPRLIAFNLINENPIPLCLEDSCNLTLKYYQNYFSFQLSAFDFSERKDLKYSYILEGFDKNWLEMGKDRMGFYSNVDPGNYILKFRVRNISGNWVEGNQKLSITIDPPFWKTKLFAFLLIGLIFGIVYWFMQFKFQSIQREERMRSEFEIKLHEMENSALRTQMNPHFIFNCLSTINAFVQKNDRTNAGLMISKFSKLIRMILNHSRQKRITIKEEIDALELYIQIENTRFDPKLEYSITIDPDIYSESIEFPSLILQPFVENAILHGLLPLKSNRFLKINVYKKEDYLMCTIEDNGIGRQAAKELRQTNSQLKSHGMDITLKRIELFNTENNLNEKVIITDLFTPDGKPKGTRIEIPIAICHVF